MKKEGILLAGSLLFNFSLPALSQSLNDGHSLERPPEIRRFPFVGLPFSSFAETLDSIVLRDCCRQLSTDRRRIFLLFDTRYRMSLRLKGVYTWADKLFFRLHLINRSHLDYETDSLRFYIVSENQRGIPGLRQVRHVPSLYVYGNPVLIRGKSNLETVVVLPRFTLPEGSRLVIQVMEKSGGRNLHITTGNNVLLRARQI